MIDKLKEMIKKWTEYIDKLLDQGEYQPSNNEPTEYS